MQPKQRKIFKGRFNVVPGTKVSYLNNNVLFSASYLPFKPPYKSYVVGAGIVEASTGNIAIGTPVSGIVMNIYVKVGEHVEAGDPLFKIDDRDLQARLLTARARVKEATASLKKPKQALALNKKVKKV